MRDLCLYIARFLNGFYKHISQWNPFILTLRNVLSVTFQRRSLFCVPCRNHFLMGSNLMPFGFLCPNTHISVSGPLTLHRENIQYFFLFEALQSLLDNTAVLIDNHLAKWKCFNQSLFHISASSNACHCLHNSNQQGPFRMHQNKL